MGSEHTNPNLEWYVGVSAAKDVLPRCPFASVHRCPRYYQSLSLLGEAGSTKIEPDKDSELLTRWGKSDLWPVTREQATSTFGPEGHPKIFSNFCPEVSFDRFGWFASYLSEYSDEIDFDAAHAILAREGTPRGDAHWQWESLAPMHYTACPVYAPLMHSKVTDGSPQGHNPSDREIVQLKPGAWGITVDLKALARRAREWVRQRRDNASKTA